MTVVAYKTYGSIYREVAKPFVHLKRFFSLALILAVVRLYALKINGIAM